MGLTTKPENSRQDAKAAKKNKIIIRQPSPQTELLMPLTASSLVILCIYFCHAFLGVLGVPLKGVLKRILAANLCESDKVLTRMRWWQGVS
jgi:hypothetical protein